MVLEINDKDGKKVSELELADEVFSGKVNEALFYETVKAQLAGRRSGTASTKIRSEVSGGGAKPWRQKGTGRARAGSNRSPLWRHGGTIFGPRPRDYSYKLPKKAMKNALLSALRLKLKEGRVKVFDSLELPEPKTKAALEVLQKAGLKSALVVLDEGAKNFKLAARNLRDFKTLDAEGLNVYDILNYDDLVITKAAFDKVEARVKS